MAAVLITEFLKLRRASVLWGTLGALMAGPLGIALLIWIVQDPERAARTGLLGAKADLTGVEATWPAYSSFVVLVIGSAGWLVLAFIMAYVFGREYSDHTATAMFTFPVPRHHFATAKFLVTIVWWLAIAAVTLAEAILVGLALGLTGWTPDTAVTLLRETSAAVVVTWLAGTPIALLAVWSRGYLAPIGAALALLLAGQLLGQTGWATWFPWSVLVTANTEPGGIPAHSWIPLLAAAGLGIAATIGRYRTADNH
jgi:ABC-2 type transport system permease protein